MWFSWQRRRRHSEGPLYVNTNWGIPTSWGVHEGRETYNVTRRRGSIRMPFGLGSLRFGRGRHRS